MIRMMADDFHYDRPIGDYDLALANRACWISPRGSDGDDDRGQHSGPHAHRPRWKTARDFIGEKFTGPGIGVRWVEVEGPLVESWPPPSVQKIFCDVPVKLMKRRYGPRAYEIVPADPKFDAEPPGFRFRPVRSAGRFRQRRLPLCRACTRGADQKATFETAIRRAYKAILTSPKFLFLRESGGSLDDFALAARLSYFLWSTTPDDELLRLASAGKLHEPAILHEQTERLLNSPRAHALTKNFCGQWLNLHMTRRCPMHGSIPISTSCSATQWSAKPKPSSMNCSARSPCP